MDRKVFGLSRYSSSTCCRLCGVLHRLDLLETSGLSTWYTGKKRVKAHERVLGAQRHEANHGRKEKLPTQSVVW